MSREENLKQYRAACHAMQTGVAMDQATGSQCGSPKHLRVGVNVAMVDHASLVKLLISKGLITDDEYCEAIRQGIEDEVERYERLLSERSGSTVKLY